VIASKEVKTEKGYGTTIKAKVTKNIPDPQAMREVISARFIHDPQFTVCVNDEVLELTEMPGVEEPIKTHIEGCGNIEVTVIDSLKSAKTKQKQGFAFWVRNRLVGEPSWTLGNMTPIDARTKFGRRFTIVVKCDDDDIDSEIYSDWSGFKKGDKRTRLFNYLCSLAKEKYQSFSKEKIDDTKREALKENLSDIRTLNRTAKADVAQFVDSIVEHEPTVSANFLSTAVQAVINLQQTKSGQRLLEKLSELPSDDVDALERILSEWSVQDALTVLDEIDRRIATVRAIEILAQKDDTDELHTLHPLVTESRWLFGPEFETSEYASNLSLKNAVNKVFKVDGKNENYQCPRKRPDLLIRPNFTLCAVALEDVSSESNLFEVSKVLLLELKKGNSQIGKKEIHQAEDYIDEIRNSGCIAGAFYTHSYVIGSTLAPKATMLKTLKADDGTEHSSIRGVCYSTLTQNASRRLFQLKDKLQDRYSVSVPNNRSRILDELLDQQELKL